MAMTETWKDKSGERKERTEWVNISIWNEHLGKIAEAYLRKGSKVYIEGQIQTREYTDKDGVQRKVTEVVLPRFNGHLTLLDSAKDGAQAHQETTSDTGRRTSMKDYLNDEMPFAPEWR